MTESIWFMVEIQNCLHSLRWGPRPIRTNNIFAKFSPRLWLSTNAIDWCLRVCVSVRVSCVSDGLWYNPFEVKTFRLYTTSDVRNLRLETRRRQEENFTSNDKTNLKSNGVRLYVYIGTFAMKKVWTFVLREFWSFTFAFYHLRYSSVKFNSRSKLLLFWPLLFDMQRRMKPRTGFTCASRHTWIERWIACRFFYTKRESVVSSVSVNGSINEWCQKNLRCEVLSDSLVLI